MMKGIHIIREREQRNEMCFLAEDSCLTVRPAEEDKLNEKQK